ncbi:MAG TPA: FxDxF family PEP-CTERM protein [Steroidobacteraceae bacterium]
MNISRRKTPLMGALALSALIALPAAASTITLASPGQMYWSNQFVGSSGGNTTTTPTSPFGNDYALSVPGQYSFLDSFGKQTSNLTGTTSLVGPYAFQDTYKFSLGQAASGDALTVSLNLNAGPTSIFDISNLQFRLYEVPSSSTPYGLSIPAGSTIVTKWMGTSGPSNGVAVTANFANVQSGTYFLDVAGIADGTSGGTYLGQLNLAPVPLPAAAWLMLSGLAGLAAFRSKRAA